MARKPTPRFDYEYLSGLQSVDAPREIFLLDEAAQSVLSDLAEIVRWDTRWDSADFNDPDFVEFRSAIYEALKVPYHLDDLVPLLDEVEPLLRQLITSQCCYTGTDTLTPPGDATYEITPIGIEQTDPGTDTTDSNTWPPNWEVEGSGEPVFEDLAELSDYLCRAASTVFDMILDMLTVAGWYFQLSSGVTVIMREVIQVGLARLFHSSTGTIVAFAFDNIDGWLQAVEDGITRAAIETAKTELETARGAIICAMATATTWQGAVTAVQAVLSATLTSSVVNAWMISGGLVGFAIGLLFRAWADPADNECICGYEGFTLEPGTYNEPVNITNGATYTISDAGRAFNFQRAVTGQDIDIGAVGVQGTAPAGALGLYCVVNIVSKAGTGASQAMQHRPYGPAATGADTNGTTKTAFFYLSTMTQTTRDQVMAQLAPDSSSQVASLGTNAGVLGDNNGASGTWNLDCEYWYVIPD